MSRRRLVVRMSANSSNYHGSDKMAKRRGWAWVKLDMAEGNYGRRLIRYFSDGSWVMLDICWVIRR